MALIVEALTDNRNRTATNVRTAFSKNGGNLAATGAVSHGFERMGMIEYPAGAGDEDKVLEAAIEAGADDVESDDDGHTIWTGMDGCTRSPRRSRRASAQPESVKLAWKPSLTVESAKATRRRCSSWSTRSRTTTTCRPCGATTRCPTR